MGFITAVTDVQDSTGASLIVQRPNGTRSPIVLQLGAGLTGSFLQSGDLGIVTLTPTAPSVPATIAIPSVTYADASPHTVATIPVPAGGIVVVDFLIVANLGTSNGVGNVNAPNAFGVWKTTVMFARVGSGSVQVALAVALATASAPFCHVASASSTGLVAVVGGATSAAIQVNGFAVTEAWTSGHTYTRGDSSTTPGQFVTNAGNVYVCTTSGTASGSAPTGTGTGLGTGALFDYVCAGSTIPVQWTGAYSVPVTG